MPCRGMGDIAPDKQPVLKARGGWINKAIGQPGALHRELAVPEGEKIPAKELATAAQVGGVLGKRARLAETLKGFRK